MNAEYYMQRALTIARKGSGYVHPNPMVGCVIVKDGTIISEGFHQQYGGNHAERNAILELEKYGFQEWDKVSLYVTLEPCSHYGKTPPCADLIIEKGIQNVYIASIDPNPIVAGKGIKKLQDHGVKVKAGILEKEAQELNHRFFTYHIKKRPYIILKWAETKDGLISRLQPKNREENIISSLEAMKLVHTWRSEEQSILVGYNTVIMDNPRLNVRLVEGKNPVKIVLDKMLSLDSSKYEVFKGKEKRIVFNTIKTEEMDTILYQKIDWQNLTTEIVKALYSLNIVSVLIEGGAKTLQQFIDSCLFDEIRVIKSKYAVFQEGIKAPLIPHGIVLDRVDDMEQDKIFWYRRV